VTRVNVSADTRVCRVALVSTLFASSYSPPRQSSRRVSTRQTRVSAHVVRPNIPANGGGEMSELLITFSNVSRSMRVLGITK